MFHSSKEVFLHNFRQFLENWIFEGISTGMDLTKMVKICIILICAKKIFFGKIIYTTHQKKCFSTILGNFWKIEFLKEYRQARPLQKMVKIWTILNCAKKLFFGKIICSTHERKCSSTILGNFWKIEFLKEYRQAGTLQKWWKFVLSQFVLRKYFLAKLFVPLIKGSVSPQFYAIFGKLNFWRNIDRLISYKNGENLYYLNLCWENIFWQNYLFHSSKEVLLHNFTQFLENWIFEGISTGANLTKMVKIFVILICAKKIFFCKIIYSLIKGSVSPQFYAIFGKLNFWRNIDRPGPYKVVKIWTILNCAKKFFFGKLFFYSSKEEFLHSLR